MDIQKIYTNLQKFSKTQEKAKFSVTNTKVARKIHLALIDDINDALGEQDDMMQGADTYFTDLQDLQVQYENLGDEIKSTAESASTYAEEMQTTWQKLMDTAFDYEQASEALGLDPEDNPKYNELYDKMEQLSRQKDELEGLVDELLRNF